MIYVIAYLRIASLTTCQNATWRNQQQSKWDLLDQGDRQDLKGHRENKDPKGNKDFKENKDPKGNKEFKESEDLKGNKDPKGNKEFKESEDLKGNKDPQDLQVHVVVQPIVKIITESKTTRPIRIRSIQSSTSIQSSIFHLHLHLQLYMTKKLIVFQLYLIILSNGNLILELI
jgi:hypothetical protein